MVELQDTHTSYTCIMYRITTIITVKVGSNMKQFILKIIRTLGYSLFMALGLHVVTKDALVTKIAFVVNFIVLWHKG